MLLFGVADGCVCLHCTTGTKPNTSSCHEVDKQTDRQITSTHTLAWDEPSNQTMASGEEGTIDTTAAGTIATVPGAVLSTDTGSVHN